MKCPHRFSKKVYYSECVPCLTAANALLRRRVRALRKALGQYGLIRECKQISRYALRRDAAMARKGRSR